jgi:hypothetical protein
MSVDPQIQTLLDEGPRHHRLPRLIGHSRAMDLNLEGSRQLANSTARTPLEDAVEGSSATD